MLSTVPAISAIRFRTLSVPTTTRLSTTRPPASTTTVTALQTAITRKCQPLLDMRLLWETPQPCLRPCPSCTPTTFPPSIPTTPNSHKAPSVPCPPPSPAPPPVSTDVPVAPLYLKWAFRTRKSRTRAPFQCVEGYSRDWNTSRDMSAHTRQNALTSARYAIKPSLAPTILLNTDALTTPIPTAQCPVKRTLKRLTKR